MNVINFSLGLVIVLFGVFLLRLTIVKDSKDFSSDNEPLFKLELIRAASIVIIGVALIVLSLR